MSGQRVLVIEDNADGREALGMLLLGWGYVVEAVGTTEEAVTRAPGFRPETIILDLGLGGGAPDCNVIHQLRMQIPGVRLVVYSGHRDLEGPAREAGCDDYIVKPEVDALEALFGESGVSSRSGSR
jgi:two-component system CheB/CheR fusion protein